MFKRINNYEGFRMKSKRKRKIPEDLPFGFRLGGFISFDEVFFTLLPGELGFSWPGEYLSITHYGIIEMESFTLHRFYTVKDQDQMILQVVMENKRLDEIKLFKKLDEVHFQSMEDREFWLSEIDGSIGLPAFQSMDGKLYQRSYAPSDHYIPPMTMEEYRFVQSEKKSESIVHQVMLYERTLWVNEGQITQYMLLSAEKQGEMEWVDIYKGIDLDQSAFSNPVGG